MEIYRHSVNQGCCAGGVDDGALNATTMAVLCGCQQWRRSALDSDDSDAVETARLAALLRTATSAL
eukprot:6180735-Pleurochrysis_carterae.AAC.2